MADIQLPLAKIKRIAKLDPDVNLVSSDATAALALSTQLFIQAMAKQVHQRAEFNKRKTLQMRDVDECIRDVSWMEFLDEALVDWPGKADLSNFENSILEESNVADESEIIEDKNDDVEMSGNDDIAVTEVINNVTESVVEESQWNLQLEDTMQPTLPDDNVVDQTLSQTNHN